MKFYETKEFEYFIKNHVIPGNGDHYYTLRDDGRVAEYTNGNDYCPADTGHIVCKVRRDPYCKSVESYKRMFKDLEDLY